MTPGTRATITAVAAATARGMAWLLVARCKLTAQEAETVAETVTAAAAALVIAAILLLEQVQTARTRPTPPP